MSVLIHVGVIALLLFAFQTPAVQKKVKQVTDIYFTPSRNSSRNFLRRRKKPAVAAV